MCDVLSPLSQGFFLCPATVACSGVWVWVSGQHLEAMLTVNEENTVHLSHHSYYRDYLLSSNHTYAIIFLKIRLVSADLKL